MDIAGAWYTSGTFWAGAGVVVAVLAAVAAVWVTLSVGFPRRRLYYGVRAAAPLLTAPPGMRSDLKLLHGDTELTDPYVLTVELISRGRKDISNDSYNGGQPLQLDVGARIIKILQITSEPETLAAPEVAPSGTLLRIGPSLIGKRHQITINVLTDGGQPSLTCRSPLVDVQVRQRIDDRTTLTWLLAVVAGMLAIAATAAIFGTSVKGLGWLTVAGAVVTLLTVTGVTMVALQDLRSRH
jgi:uncharacterized membrane protein